MSPKDPEHDVPLIDEFGHQWPEEIQWHGSTVEVTARLIPRFLWTTASIDVFIDGECVTTESHMNLAAPLLQTAWK